MLSLASNHIHCNIIKWPMTLGARRDPLKMLTKYCSEIYVPYTLIDILDEGSIVKIECSLVFHKLYMVTAMKYISLNYLARSRLMTVPCISNGHHTTVALHHIHDVTKPLVMLLLHCDVTWAVVA